MIVSVIEIDNVGISKLSIGFSLNKSQSFTTVVSNYTVPHNKLKSITTGTFPALYIRFNCHSGTPISCKNIRVFGVDPETVGQQMEMQRQGVQLGVESYLRISQIGEGLLK